MVQDSDQILNTKLDLQSLQVQKELQMTLESRDGYKRNFQSQESEENLVPYDLPIKNLIQIDTIESPMCKLEHIYKCCTTDIQKSLDAFWKDFDIPTKKLSVDVDNLQSLIVYLISRIKGCPQIIANLYLIEDFLPEAVQLSNRAFYLAMM